MSMMWLAVLLAVSLAASACGGGDDDDGGSIFGEVADEAADDPVATDDASADNDDDGAAPAGGPVRGLLTSQPTFTLGLYAIDRQSGEFRELETDDVEFVDRQNQPIVAGDAAFTLGFSVRPDQSFANDVSLVRVDLATGSVSALVALGFDRETDDSQDLIEYRLVAASSDEVLVRTRTFGGNDAVFTRYDAATGAELGSFPEPTYEFEFGDGGSCSGGVIDLSYMSDGRIAGRANGAPGYVDPATGAVELAVPCEETTPRFDDVIAPADFESFALLRDSVTLTPEDLASLFSRELSPDGAFVEGDGALWWISVGARTVGDATTIIGAIVRFDLGTNTISSVWPLGDHAGEYIDCPPGGDSCELSTLQGQLHYVDGRLVIVDSRENAPVVIFDPATGSVQELTIELGEGIDFTTADLVASDPAGAWVEVRRMVITKDDDTGRSAEGRSFLELIDPATGQIAISVPVEDLIGF